jgi:hypothetical protein
MLHLGLLCSLLNIRATVGLLRGRAEAEPTPMSLVGFEPTIAMFQRTKTVRGSHCDLCIRQIVKVDRPRRPAGLRDVEGPSLSRQSAHRWR